MVHNGIEYGLMAAYAEGFNLLREANAGTRAARVDAETAPRTVHGTHLAYDFDLAAIAELWRHGSVVRSWLLDLTSAALARDPSLDGFLGEVSDSGEGRWTVNTAIDAGVPVPVLATALFARFARATTTTSRTGCCRRCGASSAATSSARPRRRSSAAP